MRASEDKTGYIVAGNAKLTRRVKALSQSRGLAVIEDRVWGRYGWKTRGYRCDPEVLREVSEGIRRELAQAQERHRAKVARLEALRLEADRERRAALEADIQKRFPLLPLSIRADCLAGRVTLYGPGDEVPWDSYSPRQWLLLGASVREGQTPRGYAVRVQGVLPTPLFGPSAVRLTASRKARWSGMRLWGFWREGFDSDMNALATAVRFANRLVKLDPFASGRHSFYAVKDRFIGLSLRHLRECRVCRREAQDCWDCDGASEVRGNECWSCDGTGIFSARTLYEYQFDFAGEEFCFHSYVAPPAGRLSDAPGAGGWFRRRFGAAELPRVRLRVAEFTRMIEFALPGQQARPPDAAGPSSPESEPTA